MLKHHTLARVTFVLASALGLAPLATMAQTPQQPSDQDKHFLEEIAQDSNYEIRASQLALKKANSADVKQYAAMVVHDHTALERQIRAADRTAGVSPVKTDSMSVSDHAVIAELDLLSGDSFDKAYIKHMVSGNDQITQDEKTEAADSTLPAVKALAQHSIELDTKHAAKAKQLAAAHNVQP